MPARRVKTSSQRTMTLVAAEEHPAPTITLSGAAAGSTPKLDARPDPLDFRDQMFAPTLVEVPRRITLDSYRAVGVPILDQGARAPAPASASRQSRTTSYCAARKMPKACG